MHEADAAFQAGHMCQEETTWESFISQFSLPIKCPNLAYTVLSGDVAKPSTGACSAVLTRLTRDVCSYTRLARLPRARVARVYLLPASPVSCVIAVNCPFLRLSSCLARLAQCRTAGIARVAHLASLARLARIL